MTVPHKQEWLKKAGKSSGEKRHGLLSDLQCAQLSGNATRPSLLSTRKIANLAPNYRKPLDHDSRNHVFSNLCSSLRERPCIGDKWATADKAFACAWLNSQQAVVGTKCNKLLLLSVSGRGHPRLPPLQEVALPRPAARPNREAAQPNAVQNALWSVGMLLRSAQRRSENGSASVGEDTEGLDSAAGMIATAMANLGARTTPILGPGEYGVSHGGIQTGNCGIHCIALTPDRSMLACGGFAASDCQTFRVEEDSCGVACLTPSQTLVGHKDWIFGSAWVTDRHIVTGSRDRSLKLWNVDASSSSVNAVPLCSQIEENGKVRDVKYLDHIQRVASLAVNGTVQILDAHLNKIGMAPTPYEREVVCMAASESIVAVGSQNHVSFVDPRVQACVSFIANAEHNHGVRSLAFCNHLMSVGGGQGRIHFFDLRMGRRNYLEHRSWAPAKGSYYLQTGDGHLVRNSIYLEHFEGMEVRNACYAHAWDPTETKLLAVGGPLAFGLSGNYAATWS